MRTPSLSVCSLFAISALTCAFTLAAQPPTAERLAQPEAANPAASPCGVMDLGHNPSLNGFIPFLPTDLWREDIANAPVDGHSDAIIAYIGRTTLLKANFGAELYYGGTQGIPYQVVSGHKMAPVTYTAYPTESDPGPIPAPANLLIEGYPNPDPNGDRHALLLDRDNCFLYELYQAVQTDGKLSASSGAIFDLLSNSARPYGWTSADAAGLPIFPGLARADEVKAGVINHALRFTLPKTIPAIVPPATHWAETTYDDHAAPMGMRMRLRADFDISKFPPQAQVILTALKRYGMILADNGSAMFISGAPSPEWNDTQLYSLHRVKAEDFEVLQEKPLYTQSNLPKGNPPAIQRFSETKVPGEGTTLAWQATGASYFIVSPGVGAIRGNTVNVRPAATTTYTLYAANASARPPLP